ncbi:bifunctional diguanylate cyclase/phosphodiesterase [Denitromonas iodatirespirans]|uniref:EAL domain-containing protein n=1 Tax=Denitromonas iodatirespirans TaxID=2795389 RepID=A0A944D5A5_DENI1|nr:EAL domain-containing protein [Denitromonas iodatirespirans]MBT0960194.1 EAL domain-containing protein [Denitromonas iodatirespirans]
MDRRPPQLADDDAALSREEQGEILDFQQALLGAIARGDATQETIEQLCRLKEQLVPNAVASVLVLNADADALQVLAAPSIPREACDRLHNLRPGPGAGSCGNAVFRAEPVYVSNTRTDPRWADLRSLADDFDVRACWSMPIFGAAGKVVGSLALSSFEHRAPSAFHRKLLEIGAHLIGIVLERQARDTELRLAARLFQTSQEGILITDADNRIQTVNPAFTRTTGYRPDECIGKRPSLLSSGRHDKAFYQRLWADVLNKGHWQGEIWNRRKNGDIYPEWLVISAIRDSAGEVIQHVGIFSDLSERHDTQDRIRFLATHDALTELPNRMLLEERCSQVIAWARQASHRVALLFVDVDNLKLVNDSLGHTVGDELLRSLAQRLRHCVGEKDLVSRLGGDEFIVLLDELSETEVASQVAERIIERISAPYQTDSGELVTSVSIGIAVYPDDGDDFNALLRKADAAMYQAKEAGRNTFRSHLLDTGDEALNDLTLRNGLRPALTRGEFSLHYQPIIALASGKLIGAEALLRWQHPTLGNVPPNRFIPVAELSGHIVAIGDWVLGKACQEAAGWAERGLGPLMVSVNLSPLQLRHGSLEASVAAALSNSGLDGRWLELEITESTLMGDTDALIDQLNRLKAMGIRLAVDDFGTGYSCLAYLRRLPVDRLKIDRAFMADIGAGADDASIVRAIIQMAVGLGLGTTAEGVEHPHQHEALKALGCDEVQGYLYAHPMPAEQFVQWASAHAGQPLAAI